MITSSALVGTPPDHVAVSLQLPPEDAHVMVLWGKPGRELRPRRRSRPLGMADGAPEARRWRVCRFGARRGTAIRCTGAGRAEEYVGPGPTAAGAGTRDGCEVVLAPAPTGIARLTASGTKTRMARRTTLLPRARSCRIGTPLPFGPPDVSKA